jgi:hypothetical protein
MNLFDCGYFYVAYPSMHKEEKAVEDSPHEELFKRIEENNEKRRVEEKNHLT